MKYQNIKQLYLLFNNFKKSCNNKLYLWVLPTGNTDYAHAVTILASA